VKKTCKAIPDNKLHKVGLYGTKLTTNNGFYQKTAERYGIEIVITSTEQQDYIQSKYMYRLLFNNYVPETKEQLIRIIFEFQ